MTSITPVSIDCCLTSVIWTTKTSELPCVCKPRTSAKTPFAKFEKKYRQSCSAVWHSVRLERRSAAKWKLTGGDERLNARSITSNATRTSGRQHEDGSPLNSQSSKNDHLLVLRCWLYLIFLQEETHNNLYKNCKNNKICIHSMTNWSACW